ncbi:MAG: nickel insertion protein, partial [Myxococcota bacterium]|nr:nickel insertion protein [Myxococcota bacterium]
EHWMERLFEAGALDVVFHPLQMKKSRPGFALRVVAPPDRRAELAHVILDETPTLGVRASESERIVVERETLRVETPWGRVRVKRSRAPGGRLELSAEVDDCRRVARRHGVALREVVRVAESLARERAG